MRYLFKDVKAFAETHGYTLKKVRNDHYHLAIEYCPYAHPFKVLVCGLSTLSAVMYAIENGTLLRFHREFCCQYPKNVDTPLNYFSFMCQGSIKTHLLATSETYSQVQHNLPEKFYLLRKITKEQFMKEIENQ